MRVSACDTPCNFIKAPITGINRTAVLHGVRAYTYLLSMLYYYYYYYTGGRVLYVIQYNIVLGVQRDMRVNMFFFLLVYYHIKLIVYTRHLNLNPENGYVQCSCTNAAYAVRWRRLLFQLLVIFFSFLLSTTALCQKYKPASGNILYS